MEIGRDGGEETCLEGVFHLARAGWSSYYVVGGMRGNEGAGQELGGEEGEVVTDREDGSFCVKMPNAGHPHAASSNAGGGVLKGLELLDGGGFSVGEPDRGCICN